MKKRAIVGTVLAVVIASGFSYYIWQKHVAEEREKKFGYTFRCLREDANYYGWSNVFLENTKKDVEKYGIIFTPEKRKQVLAKRAKEKKACEGAYARTMLLRADIESRIAISEQQQSAPDKVADNNGIDKIIADSEKNIAESKKVRANARNIFNDYKVTYDTFSYKPEETNTTVFVPTYNSGSSFTLSPDGYLTKERGWTRVSATEYIKPNAYGLGTHMNQYGMPVKTVPAR